jgi:hypothetical protein
MCGALPAPAVPIEAWSGFALSQAMNPFRSLAGAVFFATRSMGASGSKATGSKSFTTSYWT